MDNRFGEMETFLAVARGGSFAAAAKELRLTPSAVSRAIARLEARLGVVLVRRTTRALALTAEGEAYRDRAAGLVAEIDEIERGIGQAEQGPRGRLRVSTSVGFGALFLVPILPRFMTACPRVTVELHLSDTLVDLVEERADVAIRIGPLRDTRLRAKKLGRSTMVLVASPDYLAPPARPAIPTIWIGTACSPSASADRWRDGRSGSAGASSNGRRKAPSSAIPARRCG